MTLASDLISETLPPAKLTDTVEKVLDWMSEFKVTQIPVVSAGKYLGIVHENDLLDAENPNILLSDLLYQADDVPFRGRKKFFILESKHLYDVLAMMGQNSLEILPVIDTDEHYLGTISVHDITKHLGDMFSVSQEGSILIVETLQNNYSLAEVGRIVESANAKVLSLYVNPLEASPKVQITLKLNVVNPSHVVAAFERFHYTIIMAYHHSDTIDEYRSNFSHLMTLID